MRYTFFRYPGGKARLYSAIALRVGSARRFVEPFFGGGGFGLRYLSENNPANAVINDGNPSVADLWRSVRDSPDELKRKVREFVPSVSAFASFRDALLSGGVDGFKELVLHQISYSGLGAVSGGPLGGKNQNSQYTIGCRWTPETICRGIDRAHGVLRRTAVFCDDFEDILIATDSPDTVFYLDPPYYAQGGGLYVTTFTQDTHERLANLLLRGVAGRWVLSYDNCSEIKKMYAWATVIEVPTKYTIVSKKDNQNTELLIWNR